MKMKNLLKRTACLALAGVMALSVMMAAPDAVKAADKSFKGKGSSTVTITDAESYNATQGTYTYVKIKPKYDGYFTVKASNASAQYAYTVGKWALCDKNKKLLTAENDFSTNYDDAFYFSDSFGVKKNTVYYLRVAAAAGTNLKCKVYQVKEKSGKSRTKGVSLKRNKKAKGIIAAGEKKVDWYKINLTKKQYLNIYLAAKTNYGIKMTIYKDSKSLGSDYTGVNDKGAEVKVQVYSQNSYTGQKSGAQPGNYYVKIERYNKLSSGYYTLRWK